MLKINGAATVARQSECGVTIYYDFKTCTVNTKGNGHLVTMLIRKSTAEEIRQAVRRWMAM